MKDEKKIGIVSALLVVVVWLLIPAAAHAGLKAWSVEIYRYDSTAGTTYYSGDPAGVTTAYTESSGVSNLVRTYGHAEDDVKHDPFVIDIRHTTRKFAACITDMDVSLAASAATDFSSATTGTFIVKAAGRNTPEAWANATEIPVFEEIAVNSGASVYDWPFVVGANHRFLRAYFRPSGVTPFNKFKCQIREVENLGWDARELRILASTMTVMGASGTTKIVDVLPGGQVYPETQCVGVEVNGNDASYTVDGFTTPVAGTHLNLTDGGPEKLLLPHDVRRMEYAPAGAGTMTITQYTYWVTP